MLDKKKSKEKINDKYETVYVATHPTRLNILIRLESGKMYNPGTQSAKALSSEPSPQASQSSSPPTNSR